MKIRYYKLFKVLKERGLTLEGLRRELGLFPSEIAKIETNRPVDLMTLIRICPYLGVDVFDILDVFPEEDETFYNKRILEANSYTPKHWTKKEFAKDNYEE
ncbi:MAG: helix-turn-helix transcriptional regulator [Clostridia bacterium]|nr:helix-turn-helix transcriptional regulator [Clostridia bacterium]